MGILLSSYRIVAFLFIYIDLVNIIVWSKFEKNIDSEESLLAWIPIGGNLLLDPRSLSIEFLRLGIEIHVGKIYHLFCYF